MIPNTLTVYYLLLYNELEQSSAYLLTVSMGTETAQVLQVREKSMIM